LFLRFYWLNLCLEVGVWDFVLSITWPRTAPILS